MKLESLQNEHVKFWCKLKEKKHRDETNLFLIEGEDIVKEAIKKGCVKELIVQEKTNYSYKTYIVTKEIMKKISETVTPPTIMAVCEKLEEKNSDGVCLVLDDIQDPGNLGTILRSAVAFSIPNIILSPRCVDLYNRKVIRSTKGMFFHLNIKRCDLLSFYEEKKQLGYTIYGTDVLKGVEPSKITFSPKTIFIIGNEGQGLSSLSKSFCDKFIYIPMNLSCESLNASVSASILMYEYDMKRRIK